MLIFCTSNNGKFTRFCDELSPYGLTAVQRKLDLREPQESEIPEVARIKAEQAFKLCNQPVVVEDSGLCIPALNNFPEALTKPILARLGLAGFLKLLEGVEDRRCYFISCLGYADAYGQVDTIVSRPETGELMREPSGENFAQAWSVLSHIFRPTNFDKTMAAMTPEEHAALYTEWRPHNVFCKFAQLVTTNRARFEIANAA